MTKRVVATIVIAVLALAVTIGLATGCGGGLPDSAVAKVGEKLISQEQFDQRLAEFKAQYGDSVPSKEEDPEGYHDFELYVMDYLVVNEVVNQKAASMSISVTDEDVQKDIDNIITTYYSGDETKFNEDLATYSMTLDQLKTLRRESLLFQKVSEEVTKDITTIPDADIAAYYEENKANYFVDETRTVRHILISPTADTSASTSTTTTVAGSSTETTSSSSTTTTAAPTEADWEKALTTATKVRAELVAGGDWTEEAAEYSDDTGTKDKGGDLGTVSKGEMVPEFEEAAFSLTKDEISEPIKSSYGYHIIQVTGITAAKQSTLDEVKEAIESNLLNLKKNEAWAEWLTNAKTELGVTYKEGMEPTTTTTTVSTTDTTSGGSATTGGEESATTTDAAESTTTTASGQTITTEGASSNTTTKP